jgi:hypothetical protein
LAGLVLPVAQESRGIDIDATVVLPQRALSARGGMDAAMRLDLSPRRG